MHGDLVSSRANLRPDLVNDPTVRPPYSYGQMNPVAINQALQEMWANASQTTRHYYDFGSATNTDAYNWVARWLLYKRFRYTDKRNQKKPSDQFDDDDDDDDDDDCDSDGPTTGRSLRSSD